MPFHFEYDMEPFTPSEAESITGVSTALQRDWRRHGYIAKQEGQARFDVFALAELLFFRLMSDRDVGPQTVHEIAGMAANSIAFRALLHPTAYAGDETPSIGSASQASSVLRKASPLGPDLSRVVGARFLLIWADGTELWTDNFSPALFEEASQDSIKKIAGPVMIIDQEVLGALLVARAKRPLVHVRKVER